MRSQHAIQKAKRKRRHKHHQNQPTKRSEPKRKTFDASVLLIHGIGNQTPGGLLDWTPSIIDEIRNAANAGGWHYQKVDSDSGRTIYLTKDSDCRRISFQECIWSDSFTRPTARNMFWWALFRLPMLPLLLLTPDSEDLERLKKINCKTSIHGPLIRFVVRLLLLIGTVALLMALIGHIFYIFRHIGMPLSTLIAAATTVLVWMSRKKLETLHRRYNLIGHVRVAASQAVGQNSEIAARVNEAVSQICSTSNSVTILAHSHGGFLAYEQLSKSQQRCKVSRLIGVGSGLRPITTLAACENKRKILGIWLILFLNLLSILLLLCVISKFSPLLESTLELLKNFTPYILTWLIPTDSSGHSLFSDLLSAYPSAWDGICILAALVLSAIFSVMSAIVASKTFTLKVDDIAGLEWLEITTSHDVVGRVPFPKLPDRVPNLLVGAEGNPLFDHLNYFSQDMLTPKIVGACLIKDVGLATEHSINDYKRLGDRLNLLLARRWRLATIVAFIFSSYFMIQFFLKPFSIFTILLPVALLASNAAIRLVQYSVNRVLRERDIRVASSTATIPNMSIFLYSALNRYIVTCVACLDLLELWFSCDWMMAAYRGLVQSSVTPAALLLVTLLHSGWMVVLCSGYDATNRWVCAAIGVTSIAPLFSLTLHPVYELTLPGVASIPLNLPFGLFSCILSLLLYMLILICSRRARREDRKVSAARSNLG